MTLKEKIQKLIKEEKTGILAKNIRVTGYIPEIAGEWRGEDWERGNRIDDPEGFLTLLSQESGGWEIAVCYNSPLIRGGLERQVLADNFNSDLDNIVKIINSKTVDLEQLTKI